MITTLLTLFVDYPAYFIMKITILLGLVAGVLGQISQNWSFRPEDIAQGFNALDSSIDGNLQLTEMLAMYDSIDVNGDGFLNMGEFTSFLPSGYHPNEIHGMFKYCDKLDGTDDDRIARINVNFIFNILDTDNNGEVSLGEFQRNMPLILKGMLEEMAAVQVMG